MDSVEIETQFNSLLYNNLRRVEEVWWTLSRLKRYKNSMPYIVFKCGRGVVDSVEIETRNLPWPIFALYAVEEVWWTLSRLKLCEGHQREF